MARLRNLVFVFFGPFCGLALCAGFWTPPVLAQETPDFAQAQAMLDFLRSCAGGTASANDVDRIVKLPGTELVVRQQNISRSVSMPQYRRVLEAACAGKVADVEPSKAGTRGEKGVDGLRNDVAPSLLWGRQNLGLLESRLDELRRNSSIANALPLARKYLPEPVQLTPKFHVVMGGRAGAAAIEDDLYFDVLSSSWRAATAKTPYISPTEVVEFFAHEAHHLGYGQILERKQASLHLAAAESQVWDFLARVMMEGSATFLINGHERETDMQRMPDFPAYWAKVPELLPAMQDILRKALAGPTTDEEYDQASSAFLGMGYHAAGAKLLSVIYETRGLKGVMDVMSDPRRLLAAYDDSVSTSAEFRFDPQIASRVARLGEPQKK
jgi:hypothetical protein